MKNLLSARVNWPLLKHTLKKQKNLLVIFTILLSITFPFTIIVRTISNPTFDLQQNPDGMRALLYIVTVMLLLFIPFIFFNYLTSKRSVDYIHSLPIKRRDLYATFALLSYLFVLIPFSIAYWSGYFLLYGIQDLSFSWTHVTFFLRSLILFGAVQSTTLFVIMNTGTTSDSIIYSMIMFVAPFIVYAAFEIFASTYIMGVESFNASNLLIYLSPSIALVDISYASTMSSDANMIVLFWFTMTLVLNAFTARLYSNWKSERSELPFNNPIFFYFVTSLFVAFFLIFSLAVFSIDSNSPFKFLAIQNLLIPILMSFVLYVGLDTIRLRSFRKISQSLKRFSIIACATLAMTTLVYVTQGFGYSRDLPELDEVKSVSISTTLGYYDPLFTGLSDNPILLQNPNDISKIIDIHQEIIDIFDKSNRFFNSEKYESIYYSEPIDQRSAQFQITYHLNNGKKFKRTYALPESMNEVVYPILPIDKVKKAKQPLFDDEVSVGNITLFNASFSSIYDYDEQEVHDSLKQEYFSMPIQQALTGDYALKYNLLYTHDGGTFFIPIDERYPNTLALLKDAEFKTNVKHETYLLDTTFEEINDGVIEQFWWLDVKDKEPLNADEIAAYQGSLRAYSLNGEQLKSLLVLLPSQYNDIMLSIPIK